MEESKKSSNWAILVSVLAVVPFFWDLLKWFTESVFDWFWTGMNIKRYDTINKF
jgi:hypothetical protein